MIQIYCQNTQTSLSFPEGTTLQEMLPSFEFPMPYTIVSAKVNNVSQGLKFRVYQNKEVQFLDVRDSSGMRVYTRSLFFVLCKAATDVFPDSRVYIEHPLSGGYYCNFRHGDGTLATAADIDAIPCASIREAIDRASGTSNLKHSNTQTLICGSLFLAGEALVELGAYPWDSSRFDLSESLRSAN